MFGDSKTPLNVAAVWLLWEQRWLITSWLSLLMRSGCSGHLRDSLAPSVCLCVRTYYCWTRQNAFSQSRVWTTTPSKPCGWWSAPAHLHLHLHARPRENLTTETPPPAGQRGALQRISLSSPLSFFPFSFSCKCDCRFLIIICSWHCVVTFLQNVLPFERRCRHFLSVYFTH